jgi:hypothetical protein
MTPNPYHVRLTISQFGENFRAELFTEDLGDTEGDLLPARWEVLDEWMPFLLRGATQLPPDAARGLGKEVFGALLGGEENSKKWSELLDQAQRQGRPLRLLIDATTEEVRDLPYGLLCEPHDNFFLFRQAKGRPAIQFVRVLRRCTPRPLDLAAKKRPIRVLLAAAEPRGADVPEFQAARWLCALAQGLATLPAETISFFMLTPKGVLPLCEAVPGPASSWQPVDFAPFCRTTRDDLREALQGGTADVLHLMAHGLGGAGLLLCDSDGSPSEVVAGELGEWCGRSGLQMAFLQVCMAARAGSRSCFGGIAQQLLNPRGGNLAAVVASSFPLDAEKSTPVAEAFYRNLAQGKAPDEALERRGPEADWTWAMLELWARPGALSGVGPHEAQQFPSPYRGLAPFLERDAEVFFGRSEEAIKLHQALRNETVVAVSGDSGSGKTSLLHAGLAPLVREQGIGDKGGWRIVSLRPGRQPAASLAATLRTVCEQNAPASSEKPKDWASTLRALLERAAVKDRPLLILFDQFEEIFTLAEDPSERLALAEVLGEALRRRPDQIRLVLGVRDDYLGPAAALPGLGRLLKRPWVLRPPRPEELREIIEKPAELHGYSFEGPAKEDDPRHRIGLVDRILADPLLGSGSGGGLVGPTAANPGTTAAALPLLEFALERLWLMALARGSREFTHDDFDELGGLQGALAKHAEETFAAIAADPQTGPAGQLLAEQILTEVVGPGENGRPRTRKELDDATRDPRLARRVIDTLVAARLLCIRPDPIGGADQVAIVHELLASRWERLGGWLSLGYRQRVLPVAPPTVASLPATAAHWGLLASAGWMAFGFVSLILGGIIAYQVRYGPLLFVQPPPAPIAPKSVEVVQQQIIRDTLHEVERHFREVVVQPVPVTTAEPKDRWKPIQDQLEQSLNQIFQSNQSSLASAFITSPQYYSTVLAEIIALLPGCHCTGSSDKESLPEKPCATPEQVQQIVEKVIREQHSREPQLVKDCVTPEQLQKIVTTAILELKVPAQPVKEREPAQPCGELKRVIHDLEHRLEQSHADVINRLPAPNQDGQPPPRWATPGDLKEDHGKRNASIENALNTERQARERELAVLSKNVKGLEGNVTRQTRAFKGFENEAASGTNRLASLAGEVGGVVDQIKAIQAGLTKVRNSTETFEAKIPHYEQGLASAAAAATAAAELKDAVTRVDSRLQQLDQWSTEFSRWSHNLSECCGKNRSVLASLDNQVTEQRASIQRLYGIVQTMTTVQPVPTTGGTMIPGFIGGPGPERPPSRHTSVVPVPGLASPVPPTVPPTRRGPVPGPYRTPDRRGPGRMTGGPRTRG